MEELRRENPSFPICTVQGMRSTASYVFDTGQPTQRIDDILPTYHYRTLASLR